MSTVRRKPSTSWVIAVGLVIGPGLFSAASVPDTAAVVVMQDECCDVANCESGPHNCISWTDPETGKEKKCSKGGAGECDQ